MDIKEIQNLIKFVSKSGVEEVKIEREDFKITIKTKKNTPQQIVVEELPKMRAALGVLWDPVERC